MGIMAVIAYVEGIHHKLIYGDVRIHRYVNEGKGGMSEKRCSGP